MLNGSGLRVVLWVSGCDHHCHNCQNKQTWDIYSGIEFDDSAYQELANALDNDYISGLTLSGGDPLNDANIETVTKIVADIKQVFPHKTIWLYTGYRFEQVEHLPIIKLLDVLVDGRYVEEQKDVNLPWCGSSNQRIIDVKQTLEKGVVVIWKD